MSPTTTQRESLSAGESFRQQAKLLAWAFLNVVLITIPIVYLLATDLEDRTTRSTNLWVWCPLFFEIFAAWRFLEHRKLVNHGIKRVVTGVIADKLRNYYGDPSGGVYWLLILKFDDGFECRIDDVKCFDAVSVGMQVQIQFLDGDKVLDLTVLSDGHETVASYGHDVMADRIITGLSDRERSLIRRAGRKQLLRFGLLVFIVVCIALTGIWALVQRQDLESLLGAAVFIAPIIITLTILIGRHAVDLFRGQKVCVHRTISDKYASNRFVVNGTPTQRSDHELYYVVCPEGHIYVNKDTYDNCTAGDAIYLELARHSRVVLAYRRPHGSIAETVDVGTFRE